jgi:hypothetical protein
MPWRPWDKLANQKSASSASRASWCSPCPFIVRLGRRALGRTCRLALMGLPTPSSSYSATQSTFGRPEATGASCLTGYRWPQRESLVGGSGSCPRRPSRLGEASRSASLKFAPLGPEPEDP